MNEKDVHITFVPHLLPVDRGIVSTIYVPVGMDSMRIQV